MLIVLLILITKNKKNKIQKEHLWGLSYIYVWNIKILNSTSNHSY